LRFRRGDGKVLRLLTHDDRRPCHGKDHPEHDGKRKPKPRPAFLGHGHRRVWSLPFGLGTGRCSQAIHVHRHFGSRAEFRLVLGAGDDRRGAGSRGSGLGRGNNLREVGRPGARTIGSRSDDRSRDARIVARSRRSLGPDKRRLRVRSLNSSSLGRADGARGRLLSGSLGNWRTRRRWRAGQRWPGLSLPGRPRRQRLLRSGRPRRGGFGDSRGQDWRGWRPGGLRRGCGSGRGSRRLARSRRPWRWKRRAPSVGTLDGRVGGRCGRRSRGSRWLGLRSLRRAELRLNQRNRLIERLFLAGDVAFRQRRTQRPELRQQRLARTVVNGLTRCSRTRARQIRNGAR
jgi:hypothetical protein